MTLIALTLAIALALGVWLVIRHQNLRLRQIEHRERLAAIEKGLFTPTEGDDTMTTLSTRSTATDHEQRLTWFRLSSLGLGFLLLFGGAGLLAGLIISEEPDLRKLWSIGLVPIMAGIGLLLFTTLNHLLFVTKKD